MTLPTTAPARSGGHTEAGRSMWGLASGQMMWGMGFRGSRRRSWSLRKVRVMFSIRRLAVAVVLWGVLGVAVVLVVVVLGFI